MPSLLRRMQRIQSHTSPVFNKDKDRWEKSRQSGRTTGLVHFGDNVGKLANPNAGDLLARLSREAKKENK